MRIALTPRTSEFYELFARAGANALEVARLVDRPGYTHVQADLADRAAVEATFATHVPQRVVQCADLRIVHQQFFDIVPVAVARLCVDIGGEPQFER